MSDQVVNAEVPVQEVAPEGEIQAEASDELGAEELELLSQEESSDAVPAVSQDQQDVQKEVNEQIQKWVLKGVKGEDIEVSDINELVKRAQKGVGAELKFEEAAQIKKEAAELLRMMNEDPLGLLEELGMDSLALAKKRLARQVEEEAKSPEQKQREAELKELQEYREKVKQIEQEKKDLEFQKIVQEEETKLENGMMGALKEEGLPVKPAYIKRMSEIMMAGLEQGVELSPKEALKFARKEVVSDLRELLDASPDEMLEDLIGSSNAKRMRKRYLTKAREKAIPTPSQVQTSGNIDEPRERKPKGTIKDWMKGKISLD
jgi:hypothetical protein